MNWYVKNFKNLTIEELYELIKARVDVFVVEQTCPYPELDNYDQVSVHMFLKIDGNIAAYVRLLPEHSKFEEASIGRVLVVEKYRNQGFARRLLEKAINYINHQWKSDKIKIQAQNRLKDFYASLGFKQISEIYIEDGIPHIDMIWKRG
ncbi:GNAT family N-acetyltransferase [Oceanobacillus halophilus]|uniref:GNAT family N-acetyltransferase n=1 Tax=Oceanobacillus halophilus TaxID=930130 RepID=A0A494ZWM1_9BACI|nr:GNAT family N-acetyltransferase [Oceanobacillus halophilus]RKQ30890.1 GNAT family N-acetyltransferase [Oceanobacillus halophilus]